VGRPLQSCFLRVLHEEVGDDGTVANPWPHRRSACRTDC
jgi:hypothetical protein